MDEDRTSVLRRDCLGTASCVQREQPRARVAQTEDIGSGEEIADAEQELVREGFDAGAGQRRRSGGWRFQDAHFGRCEVWWWALLRQVRALIL